MATICKCAILSCALMLGFSTDAQGRQLSVPDSLPPGVTPDMVAHGKAVFEGVGLCANCHGPEAMGLLGPNLTDPEWWHAQGSYLAIMQQILTGVSAEQSATGVAMPARGGSTISDADVQGVAAYVWTLSHPEAGDSLPAQVSAAMVDRGNAVFHGEGQCATCHGSDAEGNIGPNLTDDSWLHAKGTFLAIVATVMTGVSAEDSRSGVVMPPRGGARLREQDVYAVAAYVWVLSRAH